MKKLTKELTEAMETCKKLHPGKKLFRGTFNWHGEIHTLYRWAYDEKHAKHLMFVGLARRLHLADARKLAWYFDGQADNFKIIEEKDG